MPMNVNHDQTNMVNLANFHKASYVSCSSDGQEGVSSFHSSTENSCYMSQLQHMLMNEIIGQFNSRYLANYSQYSYAIPHIVEKDATPTCSAPYASPSFRNLVSSVNNGHNRINENSSSIHTTPYTIVAHTFPTTLASYLAENHSQINGILINKQYGKQLKTEQCPANEGHNLEGKIGRISISAPGNFQYNWNNWSNWSIKPV
jgi:hypothetical protein